MTRPITVVGSGASGVHFALSLLRRGCRVTMIDVGRRSGDAVLPEASLNGLKDLLPNPSDYFLGERFEAVLMPGMTDEYYGIPPGKGYVFDRPQGFGHSSSGFAPLFSFAQGGLGEVWTGGCYPLTSEEMIDFPFAHAALAPYYGEVARRIGISGDVDDLARFLPVHDHLQPPLELDQHSRRLMESYARVRARLNSAGVYLGRTRVATISQPIGSRQACGHLGRCLWGCPRRSLYTPSQTLEECRTYPEFEYVGGVEVTHLVIGQNARVRAVVGRVLSSGEVREFPVETIALAAGALLSTKIFLTTMQRESGRPVRLWGLMDNRQLLVPFVNLGMLGAQFSPDSYQYHLVGMGLEGRTPRDYVHGQITTLKTALVHPLIQRIPLDLGASTRIFRSLHAALGLVNVNFRDTRRDNSYVEMTDDAVPRLRLHYEPDAAESEGITEALGRVRRALWKLNCIVPPGMVHVRPMGASVHYAGTLPMTSEAAPLTATEYGESRDFGGLFLVDGATFPFLPAKNITFTLMANAARIAASL